MGNNDQPTREFFFELNGDANGDATFTGPRTFRDMYIQRVTGVLQNSGLDGTLILRNEAVPGRAAVTQFSDTLNTTTGIDAEPYQLGQLNTTGGDIALSSVPTLVRHGERLTVVGDNLSATGTLTGNVTLSAWPKDLTRGPAS